MLSKVTGNPVRSYGNLIWGEDVAPLFRGRFDTVSISLNAQDRETYDRRCEPDYENGYEAMLSFAKEIQTYVPHVVLSVVDCIPAEEIEACRKVCEDIGQPKQQLPYYSFL